MSGNYHHGDLKSALLSYAREQLEGAGLDGLSMREMAKAVGVSHTAAYRHFQDKQSLLDAVAAQGFEEMQQACRSALDAAAPDARARLKASGLSYVDFGIQHPRLLAHMFSAVARPLATEGLATAGAQYFDVLRRLVEAGQEEGAFKKGDARQVAQACWAMVHGLSSLMGLGILKIQSAEHAALMAYADQAIEVFLRGVESGEGRL